MRGGGGTGGLRQVPPGYTSLPWDTEGDFLEAGSLLSCMAWMLCMCTTASESCVPPRRRWACGASGFLLVGIG